ncbi:MAG: hypothetical protein WCK28_08775 [Burkholderiales bacterium]
MWQPTPGRPTAVGSPPTGPRIVYGMISALERADTIEQLIDTLGGRPVVIHHDIEKQPGLRVDRPNLHFVPDVHSTGWGTWGMCLAVLSVVRYALEHFEFDHFQLISPSCLPLRPADEFAEHIAASGYAGNMDLIDLASDRDFHVNYAWRMYAPHGSLRQRVLRAARELYFGRAAERVQPFGLAVLSDVRARALRTRVTKALAAAIVRVFAHPLVSHAPFGPDRRAFVGSVWFSADRALCEQLVRHASDPAIVRHFSRLDNTDELVFATLLGNAGRPIGPSNHFVNIFNDRGNPRTFRSSDLGALLDSRAWFARKFPGAPNAPIRVEMIGRRHAGSPAAAALPAVRPPEVVFATCVRADELPAVARLAERLDGRKLVVHVIDGGDAGQPRPQAPNIDYASAPLTGGFRPRRLNGGVMQLLRYCVECVDFDYLQLLPVDARPTAPIDEFERFLDVSPAEIHARVTSLEDRQAFGRHLSRVGASPRSMFTGLLRWAEANPANLGPLRALAADTVIAIAAASLVIRHPVLRGASLAVGPLVFGASRDACQHLVRSAADRRWIRYATAIDDDGSVLFSTLLNDGTFRTAVPTFVAASAVREPAGAPSDGAWFVSGDSEPAPRASAGARGATHRLATAGSGSLSG